MGQRRNHEKKQKNFEVNDCKHLAYQKLWNAAKTRAKC